MLTSLTHQQQQWNKIVYLRNFHEAKRKKVNHCEEDLNITTQDDFWQNHGRCFPLDEDTLLKNLDCLTAFPAITDDEYFQNEKLIKQINIDLIKGRVEAMTSYLDLSKLGITDIPNEIFFDDDIDNVSRNYLNDNNLRKYWSSLKILSCNENFLSELPVSMVRLSKLTHLYASHNRLTQLSDGMESFKKLIYLELNHNLLSELSSCLFALPKIINIQCSHNRLKKLKIEQGTLKYLNISHNNISELPEIEHLINLLECHLYPQGERLLESSAPDVIVSAPCGPISDLVLFHITVKRNKDKAILEKEKLFYPTLQMPNSPHPSLK